ncbi:nucleoside phosphorylase domain-containing protein [Aspergillus pseudocaelatus]|uniref:Nucleoside phosphorylase domain-containing protein n=1 Tax=Aspergillus pseudocaelatus TaxID=1825620 RepID=A0ABQ6X285_9EURO|nr:nucleoside phosphorylase domain-containing protein [Aspergillus pseudocaelatus]
MPQRRLSHNAYRLIAAMEILDEEHQPLPQLSGDTNIYNLGIINNHNVVIAGLPKPGNCSAATVVTQMRMTFPRLQYVLLVGIGGGMPVKTEYGPVRLGHVVVNQPTGIHSGAIQYDHGKAQTGLFERKGKISVRCHRYDHDPVREDIQRIRTDRLAFHRFAFPGSANDHLYQSDYTHRQDGVSCEEGGCDPKQRIHRPIDAGHDSLTVVHRGTIASGELVLKDAKLRDALDKEHGVLCFEMEAAGALTDFPCMVIRGISDYCDSHKNDLWQGYAAAVAAAYARQLLFHILILETRR